MPIELPDVVRDVLMSLANTETYHIGNLGSLLCGTLAERYFRCDSDNSTLIKFMTSAPVDFMDELIVSYCAYFSIDPQDSLPTELMDMLRLRNQYHPREPNLNEILEKNSGTYDLMQALFGTDTNHDIHGWHGFFDDYRNLKMNILRSYSSIDMDKYLCYGLGLQEIPLKFKFIGTTSRNKVYLYNICDTEAGVLKIIRNENTDEIRNAELMQTFHRVYGYVSVPRTLEYAPSKSCTLFVDVVRGLELDLFLEHNLDDESYIDESGLRIVDGCMGIISEYHHEVSMEIEKTLGRKNPNYNAEAVASIFRERFIGGFEEAWPHLKEDDIYKNARDCLLDAFAELNKKVLSVHEPSLIYIHGEPHKNNTLIYSFNIHNPELNRDTVSLIDVNYMFGDDRMPLMPREIDYATYFESVRSVGEVRQATMDDMLKKTEAGYSKGEFSVQLFWQCYLNELLFKVGDHLDFMVRKHLPDRLDLAVCELCRTYEELDRQIELPEFEYCIDEFRELKAALSSYVQSVDGAEIFQDGVRICLPYQRTEQYGVAAAHPGAYSISSSQTSMHSLTF